MSGTATNWNSVDLLRLVADLTGDKCADIVGFANDDVWTATSNGDGTFAMARATIAAFAYNQGWRTERHPRMCADLTGDGRADIIGFGDDGAWMALSNGDGTFTEAGFVLANLGFNQGWRTEQHPRFAADLTGDGRADIIGFGNDGVWTALNNGDGTFSEAHFVIADLGVNQGWTVDDHQRFLADITGDGRADIV
ncbi:MAG TPA: VCBS repeat-containing protein, partial [Phenylobacterium sp.]